MALSGCEPEVQPLGWIEKALGWIEKVLMLFGFLTIGLYSLFKFLFSSFCAVCLSICRGKGKTQATRFRQFSKSRVSAGFLDDDDDDDDDDVDDDDEKSTCK